MNKQHIKAIEKRAFYRRSPETKCSFYRQTGNTEWLPLRVNFSIDPEGFQRIANTGRALINRKVADFKARYTRKDAASPYRLTTGTIEARVSFSVWECNGFPMILGFSSVGRTNEVGKMEDTNDLVVIVRTLDNCRDTMEVRIYPGMYSQRNAIFEVLAEELKTYNPEMV